MSSTLLFLRQYLVYISSPCNINYLFSEDVACSNETELHYKPLTCLFRMFFAQLYYFFSICDSRLVPLSPGYNFYVMLLSIEHFMTNKNVCMFFSATSVVLKHSHLSSLKDEIPKCVIRPYFTLTLRT